MTLISTLNSQLLTLNSTRRVINLKSYEIKPNDANQRLDKFLLKSFPKLPKALMYKYVRIKRIKVNGKRAEISTRLNVGDVVDLYINDEFLEKKETVYDFMSAGKSISIVYEDENGTLIETNLKELFPNQFSL